MSDTSERVKARWAELREQLRTDIALFRAEAWEELPRVRLAALYVAHVATMSVIRFGRGKLGRLSAGLAFVTALSLVPVLVLVVSSVSALGIVDNAGAMLMTSLFDALMPVEGEATSEAINTMVANAGDAYAGFIGFLVAFATSVMLFNGVDVLLNDIWRVRRRRPLGQRLLQFWSFMTIAPALITASVVVSGRIQFVLGNQFSHVTFVETLVPTLFPLFLSATGVFVVLKVVPHTRVKWWTAAVGALVTAVLFELGKLGFAAYVSQVARVQWFRVYGALFLVPVMLVWIQISWVLVAFGAQVSYVLQNLRSLLRSIEDAEGPSTPVANARSVVALAAALAQRYTAGSGGSNVDALADAAHTTQRVASAVVDAWSTAGLVSEVTGGDEPQWIPSRPLDSISLHALLDACSCLAEAPEGGDQVAATLQALRLGEEEALQALSWRSLSEPEPDAQRGSV